MPEISKRGATAYSSPIRKLSPFADKAKQEGKQVFHLNIGQPDIKTPEIGLEAVRAAHVDILAYSPSKGIPSYRKKLTKYYEKVGISLSSDDIVVTNGASEGILFALLSCLDKGDEVIIPEPFYANYYGFALVAGVKVKTITSTIDTGFALPHIEDFKKAITPRTKAILICNPNNPTGCVYPKETLFALGKLVHELDLFLFVDEVYREFCYDGNEFFSALNIKDIEQNVIVLDSISKRYSACGVRVGAVVTRNKEVVKTFNRYAELRLSPPTYGQIFAEAVIDVADSYLDEVKQEYNKRRDLLFSRMSKMEGVTCYKPGGAFYVFAQLPIDDSDKFCQWLLESFDHNGKTVMIAPGTGFYATKGLGKNQVRIAYVLNTDDLNEAMNCLEAALKVYPGRTLTSKKKVKKLVVQE